MTIKGYDNQIPFYRHQWQDQFEQVQERMKRIDLKLKNRNRNRTQYIKDIDTFSKNNLGLSYPMFGRYLYQELSKKYLWRDWLVVVSTHTDYNHDAYSRSCKGSSHQHTEQRI